MALDPIKRFQRWMRDAHRAGAELMESVALATCDRRGRPTVRYVLLKSVTQNGFVFYTHADSRKGRDMAVNPNVALAVYWHELKKQVRVEGRVSLVDPSEADAYWLERPRASRIAAVASRQSRPLASRAVLLQTYRALEKSLFGKDVPRPALWTGYRLVPNAIEFWKREEPRLHHRELFVRRGGTWKKILLQP
jgi:pyridoxamine 5'-phosphate oxidase